MNQTPCRFGRYFSLDRPRLDIHEQRNLAVSEARYDIGKPGQQIRPLEDLMYMVSLDVDSFQFADASNMSFAPPEH
jgi:hypothetical protein